MAPPDPSIAAPRAEAAVDAAAAADAWLNLAEGPIPEDDATAELGEVLAALEALEGDQQLWAGLRHIPWERFRVAEARLRARAAEGLARARHCGTSLPEGWQPDTIRPPWSGDVARRVSARWSELSATVAAADCDGGEKADSAEVEVLCSLDCHPDLQAVGLCWHTWHLEECGGRPPELHDLLRHARATSAHAAPAHRARVVEQRWGFLAALVPVVEATVCSSGGAARVLVLGGAGVSAVAAARAGALVTVWELQPAVAGAVRAVARDNGVHERVTVIGGSDLSAIRQHVLLADVIVLEGLEPDGILGCGALEQWRAVEAARAAEATVAGRPVVVPSSLNFTVALAQARLAAASGVDVDLAPFAERYGGLAPLPRAAESTGAAAVRVRALGPATAVLRLDLAAAVSGTAAGAADLEGAALLRLTASHSGQPDSLLVRCELAFEGAQPFASETLHALPAQMNSCGAEEAIEVRCQWNTHRLWFEIGDTSSFSTLPVARAHLLDWYSEMMNDAPRNEAFAEAVAEAVSAAKASRGHCRVADLGCGVGVLSALALAAGADEVLGIEITPHLARCARRVLEARKGAASVECADLRTVDCPEEERFDLVVSELLDAGGLGEKIVPFMRHAKSRLLREGGEVVPRGLRVRAALVDARLPSVGNVDVGAFEPYWLPARASAGEWLAMDLDGGMDWSAVSDPVEVFALDFMGPQSGLVEALREKDLVFPLRPEAGANPSASASSATGLEQPTERKPRRWNAIVWWFEADVGRGTPVLSSAPSAFRPSGARATHWLQAVAGVGPWAVDAPEVGAARVRVRTDGVHLTWTPLGFQEASVADTSQSLLPFPEPLAKSVSAEEVEAWRQAGQDAAEGLQVLRREVDKVGDVARMQALQAAVLALAAQPGIFGLEATPDAVCPLLKAFYA